MKQYQVGIIGATGMVGTAFCDTFGKPPVVPCGCTGGFSPFCRKDL